MFVDAYSDIILHGVPGNESRWEVCQGCGGNISNGVAESIVVADRASKSGTSGSRYGLVVLMNVT